MTIIRYMLLVVGVSLTIPRLMLSLTLRLEKALT
jgi:hypothetical protein